MRLKQFPLVLMLVAGPALAQEPPAAPTSNEVAHASMPAPSPHAATPPKPDMNAKITRTFGEWVRIMDGVSAVAKGQCEQQQVNAELNAIAKEAMPK